MHCPIASDHIISKHIWSIHAEHDLWPLGRRPGSAHGEAGGREQDVQLSPGTGGLQGGTMGSQAPERAPSRVLLLAAH